jgi:hypothetical protein
MPSRFRYRMNGPTAGSPSRRSAAGQRHLLSTVDSSGRTGDGPMVVMTDVDHDQILVPAGLSALSR